MPAQRIEKAPGPAWWGQSAVAGLLGGGAMALVTMIWTYAQGNGFWWPLNVVAAWYPGFRPPMVGFEAGASTTGMATHLVLTTLLGLAYGAVAVALFPRVARTWSGATLLGLGWGVTVWGLVGAWIAPLLNPFLNLVPPGGFFVAHLFYGLVAALVLCAWTRHRVLSVTFAPERPVEAPNPRIGPWV